MAKVIVYFWTSPVVCILTQIKVIISNTDSESMWLALYNLHIIIILYRLFLTDPDNKYLSSYRERWRLRLIALVYIKTQSWACW